MAGEPVLYFGVTAHEARLLQLAPGPGDIVDPFLPALFQIGTEPIQATTPTATRLLGKTTRLHPASYRALPQAQAACDLTLRAPLLMQCYDLFITRQSPITPMLTGFVLTLGQCYWCVQCRRW